MAAQERHARFFGVTGGVRFQAGRAPRVSGNIRAMNSALMKLARLSVFLVCCLLSGCASDAERHKRDQQRKGDKFVAELQHSQDVEHKIAPTEEEARRGRAFRNAGRAIDALSPFASDYYLKEGRMPILGPTNFYEP
jgi:hypothetical protein